MILLGRLARGFLFALLAVTCIVVAAPLWLIGAAVLLELLAMVLGAR